MARRAKVVGLGRASLIVLALALGAALVGVAAAPDRAEGAGSDGVESRIVNGKETSIEEWPWQVALIDSRYAPGGSASDQYFCTGSLIAPEIVVTAAHCVADIKPESLGSIRVITGRTWLDRTSTGESLGVSRIVMALDSNGRRLYRNPDRRLAWDVALIELASPSSATPLTIAGASESAAWRPGRLVRTTGWGSTRAFTGSTSNRLRIATQVVLPDGVCRRGLGRLYEPKTMICHGDPKGRSSSCSGDSGGPLVSPVGGGWRLIGLTSFGDGACRGYVPSVDNRTAADPIRSWIQDKTIELSGQDPVSEGGEVGPLPRSCRVPSLIRRTRASSRQALRSAGCTLKAIHSVGRPKKGKRRVVGASLPPGWLAPVGFGIKVAVTR